MEYIIGLFDNHHAYIFERIVKMNEKLFISSFWDDDIPTWPCPECGEKSLSSKSDGLQLEDQLPVDHNDRYSFHGMNGYVFSLNLKCKFPDCGCAVMCVGTGSVKIRYSDDYDDSEHCDLLEATYFQPPLQIFVPPKSTPSSVKKALTTSFSTYFSSPSTSLSTLRTALEVLLDEIEVVSVNKNEGFVPLAARIERLPEGYQKIVAPATAIKWLGNDGTHSGCEIKESDVIDGYKIFSHILEQLYPTSKEPIEPLVDRINKAKGVVR
ncbi:MAG: DUF4145 domain-containing protein [Vibrionaceae bacterium]